ncbi:MAG TPA: hypothetical protein VGI95_09500 [Caulobacteraceae bacterium]|jgi:hypothetical protein
MNAFHWIFAAGALAVASATPALAANCHTDLEHVRLSGNVVARTLSSPPVSYAILKLDEPICYHDRDFGDVSRSSTVALLPAATGLLRAPLSFAGQHVTLEGSLTHRITSNQPDQDLLLVEPQLSAPVVY